MDDIKRVPVKRPLQSQGQTPLPQVNQTPDLQPVAPQPIESTGGSTPTAPKPKKSRKKMIILAVTAILLLAAAAGGAWFWYQAQLAPVDKSNTEMQKVEVTQGSLPAEIAKQLKEENLIRNESAFLTYARITGVQDSLQAGTYRLSPSESTPAIIGHLTKGNTDSFDITFIPGATLADNRKVLIDAGYTEEEVDTALTKTYDSPLFSGKPADTDLEGYIYGDTYRFGAGASVEDILVHVFDKFNADITANKLVAGFEAQGFTLYEGIILASIIQRETIGGDEAQIAQVFLKRLEMDMPLGSDPTYQYIAKKLGVERDLNIDSPYNTRRYAGIPPGPIAVPGLASLKAVANPAAGDYLYFLSGDDDVTYFSKTFEEHEANIVKHCKVKCSTI